MNHILHIGPQKTASSLIHVLVLEKQGLSTLIKENFYFQLRDQYVYTEYLKLFPGSSNLIFDCSPSYFSDTSLITPISHCIPDPTILVGLRSIRQLFSSFARHIHSLGLATKQQLSCSQFRANFFDPVRYSLHMPSWLSSFDKVYVLDIDLFLSSQHYRLRAMNRLFPSLNFVESDLRDLPIINEAHSYRFGLGIFRTITPYLNLLPYSFHFARLKKSTIKYLPKQNQSPVPNLSSSWIQDLIAAEIDYCTSLPRDLFV
jgi:hypothetical protein